MLWWPAESFVIKIKKTSSVYLFLGAVRDMTCTEKKVLKTVCDQHKTPFVKIRFGTVPEFTSKILSILAYHHSQNGIVMVDAIERLLQTKVDQKESALLQEAQRRWQSCLHVVCTAPLLSNQISINLEARGRVHWCLVRVIVCSTLWRSRLVSTKH
jgi:hypothetical protein